MHIRPLAVALLVASVATVSCAGEESPSSGSSSSKPSTSATTGGMDHGGMDQGAAFAFGEPADPSDTDRVIEVDALDTPSFAPAAIDVALGETVTFAVRNAGDVAHEFVLGDTATQDQHQGEMGEMGHSMADEPNAVSVAPSAETSLTWTFTEPGTVLYACHVDDHYAEGMVGQVRVANG